MSITLAKLKERTNEITVNFQGDQAKVIYRTNVITPVFQRKIASTGSNHEMLVQGIAEAVESWDILESEGGPVIEPDSEAAAALPTLLLDTVMNAIFEDMQQAGAEAKKA